MPPLPELVRFFVDWRIDAIALCLSAAAAGVAGRIYVRRRNSSAEFSRTAGLVALLVALAGSLVAEWTGLILGYPANASFRNMLLARGSVLGAAAFAVGVVTWAAIRFALFRAQLRVQADTERQLQQAKLAADEASKAKSDFLAVMSHEIRTPLNAVMGFAKLLSDTRLEDAQRGYVATITSEGERLGALINDILDLTKIEGGQLMLERLPFAPAEVAHDVLRLFAARAAEKKIDLRFEAQIADPLLVTGDPQRFRQILINLIDNAIKFTPGGSVTFFLSWTAPTGDDPRGRLVARVRDTGIGIPVEKQQKLFQLFTQIDSSSTRHHGGTGLGLAICQRLVNLMGGEISVRSDSGEGAEFRFWLPLAPVALADLSSSRDHTEFPFARPPRILVVDDLETNRFLLEVFLRRNGFEPELAKGGAEAVRLAAAHTYDAILMDLQMPEVDGYIATARIRAAETHGKHTPIIALTASLGKGIREKCLAAGMDEHMTKPLDLPRFKRLLRTMVNPNASIAAPAPVEFAAPANRSAPAELVPAGPM